MKLKLPQYSGKDHLVLAIIVMPLTLLINSVIFGYQYYSSFSRFLSATAITGISFSLYFSFCGWVAVQMKRRFPYDSQTALKLSLMILTFVITTGLFLLLLFQGYESIPGFDYQFNEKAFVWSYICMAIVNIFITLLMEGMARFRSWKANLVETEALKKTFRQSQLQGLRSQVNPHFLFNSLNTLSSLIEEDEEKAERFLNEMTKVYRYMLRSDDDQLVELDTELRFVDSYIYLLRERFGDGLCASIEVNERDRSKTLPALSLQVLIENAFTKNAVSKSSPLSIVIRSGTGNCLQVMYNKQERPAGNDTGVDKELENLVKKYSLLNQPSLKYNETACDCCFLLPLLENKKEVPV